MSERIRVLLSEEEVDRRIQEIGEQISRDYEGKQVHLVCVLKGGSFFLCELAKRITVPVSFVPLWKRDEIQRGGENREGFG